jgi:hypothetical protein
VFRELFAVTVRAWRTNVTVTALFAVNVPFVRPSAESLPWLLASSALSRGVNSEIWLSAKTG